jgi:membrane dipeptidase
LIEAIGRSGGLIGIAGFPGLVAKADSPTLSQFIEHIDAIARRIGIDHVALGIDYYSGQSGVASDEEAVRTYEAFVQAGLWSAAYPPPPHRYPAGIETPRTLPNLTEALLARGYEASAVRKILGENWLRVMRAVWG